MGGGNPSSWSHGVAHCSSLGSCFPSDSTGLGIGTMSRVAEVRVSKDLGLSLIAFFYVDSQILEVFRSMQT